MPALSSATARADPILLSLFANRFMSVAEAMGRSLQQTSISTNIKERLDYSCAIFAPNGELIANAPHNNHLPNFLIILPAHLGAMSFAVKFQQDFFKDDIHEGDVILSNHPSCGGNHLPDITTITPVFDNGELIFFTASRAHHADVGGILPGSMPPTSKTLFEEGAQIKSFKIVDKGVYARNELVRLLVDEPAKHEGCSGTRCLRDVESDLQAQIAANHKGAGLIHLMIQEYGLRVVQDYMFHIRDNAEMAVRTLLKQVAKGKSSVLHALDFLDDGTPIELTIYINQEDGSAIFDFEGTGSEMIGNLNAPMPITYSAIIYSLRAMVNLEIPLNQGCLNPITVKIPKYSVLDPSETAAVCGGNVCTSQRVTDVVLKCFGAAAASQGCCNNLTFGLGGKNEDGDHVEGWGYYETIAGGSGAGPTWVGTSGVHTHMTNTRITDPEIFERRYPVVLRQFSHRKGSGGKGLHPGGDGVIRDIEFLEALQVSILSERRVYQPFGLEGGGPGALGRNYWIKRTRQEDSDDKQGLATRKIYLSGKSTVKMGPGDRIVVETAGAGAWGKGETNGTNALDQVPLPHMMFTRGSVADRQANWEGSS